MNLTLVKGPLLWVRGGPTDSSVEPPDLPDEQSVLICCSNLRTDVVVGI